MKKYKIAVLDDYQNVALESSDWSVLRDRAEITIRFELTTFGLCDLTQLSLRVGLYLHPV